MDARTGCRAARNPNRASRRFSRRSLLPIPSGSNRSCLGSALSSLSKCQTYGLMRTNKSLHLSQGCCSIETGSGPVSSRARSPRSCKLGLLRTRLGSSKTRWSRLGSWLMFRVSPSFGDADLTNARCLRFAIFPRRPSRCFTTRKGFGGGSSRPHTFYSRCMPSPTVLNRRRCFCDPSLSSVKHAAAWWRRTLRYAPRSAERHFGGNPCP